MDLENLPGPPANLSDRNLRVTEFIGSLFRTHSVQLNPVHYGRAGIHRFDAPDGSYGVLYAAQDEYCAFIETFARSAGTNIVTTIALKERSLAEMKAVRSLRLIDLTRSGAVVRIGADARLFSGPHEATQAWSSALHDHPCKADGILYPSRLDVSRHGIALFHDRAPALKELRRQSWYGPGPIRLLLAEIVEHYGLELIENESVVARKPLARARQGDLF